MCLHVNVEENLISDYSILSLFQQKTITFTSTKRLLKFFKAVMFFFILIISVGRLMYGMSTLIVDCVCALIKCSPYALCCDKDNI
jgi:cation transport ATPase